MEFERHQIVPFRQTLSHDDARLQVALSGFQVLLETSANRMQPEGGVELRGHDIEQKMPDTQALTGHASFTAYQRIQGITPKNEDRHLPQSFCA